VAASCAVLPATTVADAGATDTATNGTVNVAEEDFVVSVTEVAVTVTARLLAGGAPGAVYVTLSPLEVEVGDTVPHGVAEQLTVQFTPALAGSKFRDALNCVVPPAWTVAVVGATETVIASTVMVANADFFESATEVAVSVTFRSLTGGVLGAEYVTAAPLDVALGETEPHACTEHDTAQVTPPFAESLPTVAVKFVVVPICKLAEVGKTETLTGSEVDEPPPQPPNATSRNSVPVRQNRPFVIMAALQQVRSESGNQPLFGKSGGSAAGSPETLFSPLH
jgi:hypothetical protein